MGMSRRKESGELFSSWFVQQMNVSFTERGSTVGKPSLWGDDPKFGSEYAFLCDAQIVLRSR